LDGSQAEKAVFGGADAGGGIASFTFHDIQNASRDKWAGDSLPLWGKGLIIYFISRIIFLSNYRRDSVSTLLVAICGLARIIEYFVIKTDETIFAENFFHKAFGIDVLPIVLHSCGDKSIGFIKDKAVSDLLKGFLLGGCCFLVAYSVECLILYQINQNVSLVFYISGFTLNGETIQHDGFLFLLLCIVLNIINVWMEEGVFRGLFMKILAEGYPLSVPYFLSLFYLESGIGLCRLEIMCRGIYHLLIP